MKTVRVEVTQADIDEPCWGRRVENCPVARALSRALGQACKAGLEWWGFLRGDWEFQFPLEVRRFILRYDYGEPVQPFTFEVQVP